MATQTTTPVTELKINRLTKALYNDISTPSDSELYIVTDEQVDYSDLTNKPTIGNATLTIQKNGTTVNTFTANASSNVTANITVPTKISDLTNDSNFANTDLSNLSSTGKNISNWSTNVSNCITEIPQDINLTLSNGTLTLKAGSKVYFADGSSYTTTSDKTRSGGASGSEMIVYRKTSNDIVDMGTSQCYSGTTQPTGVTYAVWFDTTNNIVKWTSNGFSTWQECSFPVALTTFTGGVPTRIDQVFNGFGYIGSRVFALPGVKGLAPDGRNADGTLKSVIHTISSVKTSTGYNSKYLMDQYGIVAASYANYAEQEAQPSFANGEWYQPSTNIMYSIRNNVVTKSSYLYVFDAKTSGDKIVSLTPKTVFQAVDYNDFQKTTEQVETNTTNITSKQDEATALNYDNISNCITEIPQDITIVIQANNSLAVKQGSKVYYGDSTYDILDSDKGYGASTDWGNVPFIFAIRKSDKTVIQATLNNTSSNATNPGIGYRFWFNTTDGKCYINDGQGVASETSFPVGILQHTTGTGWTNINQVFNGFGYIGSTVFVLPGVKGLIPNGRNLDGTLKNKTSYNSTTVKTFTPTNGARYICLSPYSAYADVPLTTDFYYDEAKNMNFRTSDGVQREYAVCGTFTQTNSGITNFTPKTVFHPVDYIDNEFIGHQAMPSSRYTDLTLGSTGTTYTAPADGYYTLNKGGNSGEWIYLLNTTTGLNISNLYPATLNARLFIPVSKGDIIQCQYSASGVTNWFRFIYANGAK